MRKYTREIDGETYVAVLISEGFGAGWSTWNGVDAMDGDFIEFLLENAKIDKSYQYEWDVEIDEEVVKDYYHNYKDVYCGGVDGFVIRWIKKGTRFYIDEYDGSESIRTNDYFQTA